MHHRLVLLSPVSKIPMANLLLMPMTPVAICHWYQTLRRQICHRCQWHLWQKKRIMGTISGCWDLELEGKNVSISKLFWLKSFSICQWCQRHRWCSLRCEYLREFSKKFETSLMVYSGAWGNLIHEKTRSRKERKKERKKEYLFPNHSTYFLHLLTMYL